MITKSYSGMILLPTFEERFNYLKLSAKVGIATFGESRYLNQILYNSPRWKEIRDEVIFRDDGCDLGIEPILYRGRFSLLVHHIDPITVYDVENNSPKVYALDNLVTTIYDTHRSIHFGNGKFLEDRELIERRPNDTSPWRN